MFWSVRAAMGPLAICLASGIALPCAQANEDAIDAALGDRIERQFHETIVPLMETHCLDCHSGEAAEAQLDLTAFQSVADVTRAHQLWHTILERVEAGEMPPPDAGGPLGREEQQTLATWMDQVRTAEIQRGAGDPGPVLPRRLSNAEYDYSIRDLTGVDIRPTQTFPVDPANEAGFDNSGESLAMSPALLNKYIEAARTVTDHLVFTPEGLEFAPHPVMTDTDRDKYCVKRIVDFYGRHNTDYADYFFAAWRYRHRAAMGNPDATLEGLAAEEGVSATYLQTLWRVLGEEPGGLGPLATIREMFHAVPAPSPEASDIAKSTKRARSACERMRDYVHQVRPHFAPHYNNLRVRGVHAGSQPLVLWKNEQYAVNRRTAHFSFLDAEASREGDKEKEENGEQKDQSDGAAELPFELPAEQDLEAWKADCQKFCDVFPDTFYVSERGRDYLGVPKDQQEKGRLLSAGFHSMMGYFRDDAPLYALILDEAQRRELDALWHHLDFFTGAPMRQYQGFLWFERTDSAFLRDPQFDFARPEDNASLREDMIAELGKRYLEKATENGGREVALGAIRDYFVEINEQIRSVEESRLAAQPHHVEAAVAFAERAFRRPLTSDEAQGLRTFYQTLRDEHELSHEEAIQDVIVSVLMSPHYLYRVDLLRDSDETRPLDGYELASRLSYFLWSSVPDDELLRHAAAGDLSDPELLVAQTRRMLRDERARALATEFGGNWLDFRRFKEHNSVDRERFPTFDDELRSAMFEEPIRFFIDVVERDRPILDFLYAEHTFVNAPLASHYGMVHLDLAPGEWIRMDDAHKYGRGGLLPMAVFLTKNAPGLRTSPVKRGNWVVRRLLGERVPPPPPDIPELPSDESALGERTLREALAMHRDHPSCAGCHNRIDGIGLVFEGFGPVGERRTVDLGGRPVDMSAEFPDGSERIGVAELRDYLRERREEEFLDNFSRKLIAYALGRSLILPDEQLVSTMRERSDAHGHRVGVLVETIVTSPQFLNKRGRDSDGSQ